MLRCPTCGHYLPVCRCPPRRVALLLVPVVITTVFARRVQAQSTVSGCAASCAPSTGAT